MTELKDEYITKAELDPLVNDTFTITLKRVAMIRDLIERGFGKNKSDIVRKAIDEFYASKAEEN